MTGDRWVAALGRDGVRLTGPDAVSYLQGQASQDVAALELGASAWSWILQPAGKVDALVRVTRTATDALLVDTDAGSGDALVNRLTRFKLRTKVDIEAVPLSGWALRSPGAQDAASALCAASGPGALVAGALWRADVEAADVVATGPTAAPDGWAVAGPGEWEAARIAAGVPVMGAELTERTIPGETGLIGLTVSFTKGCYTGQELVARIDSRGGHVARHLRLLTATEAIAPGGEVTVEGRVVGTLTSVAGAGDGRWVALGYVGRAVPAGAVATVAAPGDTTAAGGSGDTTAAGGPGDTSAGTDPGNTSAGGGVAVTIVELPARS